MTWGKLGILTDYKSGYRLVADAEENAQGWSYIIGTFQRGYGSLGRSHHLLSYSQPRRDFERSVQRSQLPAMQLRLNTIVRRAMATTNRNTPAA